MIEGEFWRQVWSIVDRTHPAYHRQPDDQPGPMGWSEFGAVLFVVAVSFVILAALIAGWWIAVDHLLDAVHQ